MEGSPEVLLLLNEFAAANAEFTAIMHEQYQALLAGETDLSRFDGRFAQLADRRRRAMDSLLNHIRLHGW